jgi:uncharacterized phiE125 gp8 family phage protein
MSDFYELKIGQTIDPPFDFSKADEWCRDINSADTTLVEVLINAATEQVESSTNRVFVERIFIGKFTNLCTSKYEPHPFIQLRRAPFVSVTSVKVNDVELDSADYVVKDSSSFARILFLTDQDLDFDLGYPIEVEFTVGYETVPEWADTVIKQIVLFWYENRGDVSTDKKQFLPFVAIPIIKLHRIVNTYG